MMQIAMIVGYATVYPMNWWLIKSGFKEAMSDASGLSRNNAYAIPCLLTNQLVERLDSVES